MLDQLKVLAHYNQNEFIQAGTIAQDHLRTDRNKADYSPEDLILLGRLAIRLGGVTLRKHFFRSAQEKAPEHPMVRYFARFDRQSSNPIDVLRDFETQPRLLGAEPDLEASWLAGAAVVYGQFRDFGQAHRLIDQAMERAAHESHWILSCKSEVLIQEDRWAEALDTAAEAWRLRPGTPGTANNLARAQAKLHGIKGVWEHFADLPKERRSWETTRLCLHYLLAEAERSQGAAKDDLLERARTKTQELPGLMPLADRMTRRLGDLVRLDLAMIQGNRDQILELKPAFRWVFFDQVVANIKESGSSHGKTAAPGRADWAPVFAPYKEVFQKHLTCLPSSINAVTSAFGPEFEVDHGLMARELTFDGTGTWRARDWLIARGLVVRHFIARFEVLKSLIDQGIPVVMTKEYHLSAHAVAVVGYHPVYRTLYIHDPSQDRLQEVLASHFDQADGPFGPMATLILPPHLTHHARLIQDDEADLCGWLIELEKILETQGAKAALEELRRKSGHIGQEPQVRRMEAKLLALLNELPQALGIQEVLLAEHPGSPILQRDIINSWHRTKDNASVVRMFESLIEKGAFPGTREIQIGSNLPTAYLAQYADYLGTHQEGFRKARKILLKGIAACPSEASLHHVLADVLTRENCMEEAELPYRLAAHLRREDHHYTRAYADHLRSLGREDEAFQYLQKRRDWVASTVEAPLAYLQLADALEDWGRAGESQEVLAQGLAAHPQDVDLMSWACQYYLRMGKLDYAGELAGRLENLAGRETWLAAAVQYHLKAGNWSRALELSESWISEFPHSYGAARALSQTLPFREGYPGMIRRIRQIALEHPNHEDYIQLVVQVLDTTNDNQGKEVFLRECLAHDPKDIWCLVELGSILAQDSECAGAVAQGRRQEAYEVLARLLELNPQNPGAQGIKARLEFLEGKTAQAMETLFLITSLNPHWAFPYRRIAETCRTLDQDERNTQLDRLKKRLGQIPGMLVPLEGVVAELAHAQGYQAARSFLDMVAEGRPLDPYVLETRINLELSKGAGLEGAETALALASRGRESYPGHENFLVMQIRGLLDLDRHQEALPMLEELLARDPCNEWGLRMLAACLEHLDQGEKAMGILETGLEKSPLTSQLWSSLAQLCQRLLKSDKAEQILLRGLDRNPYDIDLRVQAISAFQEAGKYDEAVDIARKGTELYPDGAYLWFIYGEAMHNSPHHNNLTLIEDAYRKALALNRQLFKAADLCAIILSVQRRHDEALELLDSSQADNPEESMSFQGRRAWVLRQSGAKQAARDLLIKTVMENPAYEWGWNLLLSWLEDDQAWDLVKELLGKAIPALEHDSTMNAGRLVLLGKAGLPWEELDAQWEEAARLFALDDSFQFRWFDILLEQNLSQKAGQVLDHMEARAGTQSWFRVRRCKLLVRQGKIQETARLLVETFRDSLPGSAFPYDMAGEVLEQKHSAQAFFREAFRVMEEGALLRPEGVEAACKLMAKELEPQGEIRRQDYLDRIQKLLYKMDEKTDPQVLMRAALLEALVDQGFLVEARLFVRNNYELCKRHPVIWGEYTRISPLPAVSGKELDEWYATWEERQGTRMWHVANYLFSRPLKEDGRLRSWHLAHMGKMACHTLATLPLDHTRRFLAAWAVEGTWRTGKQDEALALLAEWRDTVADNDPSLWLPENYREVPSLLALCLELYEAGPGEQAKKAASWIVRMLPLEKNWILGLALGCSARNGSRNLGTNLAILGLGLRYGLRSCIGFLLQFKNH